MAKMKTIGGALRTGALSGSTMPYRMPYLAQQVSTASRKVSC